jgi:hypothetical protein
MLKRCALVLFSIVAITGVSQAGIIADFATLLGTNEIPSNASTAFGSALVTIDTVLNSMRVQVVFSGLGSNDTGAHIHCCIPQPANTGVATTVPAFPGFPLGVTFGSYDQTLDLTSAASYNPAFVTAQGSVAQAEAALIAGIQGNQTYLNIHTANIGSGEIRGILAPVPEPGTMLLLAAGMGVVLLARRRRKA